MQSFGEWEHIIVDDASTDNSVSLIEAARRCDRRIRLIKKKVNSGPRHARNEASRCARGRYIAFLDSDDYWLPQKLEKQLAFMCKYDIPISAVAYEVHDLSDICLRIRHMPAHIPYSRLLYANLLSASTTIYDTHHCGQALNLCPWGDEDHHLWLQILRTHNIAARGLNQVLAVLRQRPGSRSSSKLKAAGRRWQTYRRAQGLSFASSCFWFVRYIMDALISRSFIARRYITC
jgi:teichuronic acid biosynthesis glycosyltransferase TuaG